MELMRIKSLYSFLIGIAYAVQSMGIPVGVVTVKPYQLLAITLVYKASFKKVLLAITFFMLSHALLVVFFNGQVTFDPAAYVFTIMIVVYSYLLLFELKRSFGVVLMANSFVYFIGVALYFYALYSGDYVNIHHDVSERSDLVNRISSFVFFDGTRVRYNGFALDPNFYSFYVNILFGIALCLSYIHKYHLSRLFVLMSAISVMLTLSRVGVVSLLFLLLAWGWVSSGNIKRLGVLVALGVATTLIGAASIYMGRSLFSYEDVGDSRLWVWFFHLKNAWENGVGYMGQGLTFDVVRYLNDDIFHKSTHNTVLYSIYCFGFGITAIFILMWLKRLFNLILSGMSEKSVLLIAVHLVYAMSSLTLDLMFTVPFYLYIVFCYMYPVKTRNKF